MHKTIIWSPASEEDLNKILEYLELQWSKRIVSRFINKVDDSIGLIIDNPTVFPFINKDLGVRKCVITKQNTLFYREKENSIEIIRVFDTRQDPNKIELLKNVE